MTLQSIPSPDLGAISVGLPTLQLLEAIDFSDDGRLLLVKAIYTDAVDGGATQHLGFWLFDRASGAYVQNLTAQWQASDAFVPGMALVGASIVGDSDNYQVLVKASTSGLESTDRLVAFDASGVSIPDVLADLLGPDVASRIERFAASADGRFLALQTDDPNLWPVGEVDTNEVSDILLIDRLTSQITRVSKVGGAEVTGYVQLGSIAASQGQVEVAFVTPSAFVSSDGNGNALVEVDRLDAYLWSSAFDATGLTGAASFTLLSRRVGSTAAAGGVSREHPVLVTEAGVYFTGLAPDMVAGDANDAPDVFLTTRLGAVERIGLGGTFELASGATLLDADSTGQRIALLTDASPTSSVEGLYQSVIVDQLSGQWQLASQTATGMEADDIVISGVVSPASNALAFTSAAPNLSGFDPVAQQGSLFLASFNEAPILVNAIAGQTTDEDAAFSFTVPANTFADVDTGDTLTYSAGLADGSALPTWLTFVATTRTFSGAPTNADVGALSVKVTATDGASATASDTFTLMVVNVNDAPTGVVSIGVNNGHSTADLAQGDVLTAANTLADADGLGVITYTWKTGETVLGTGASFTLTQAEVGKAITLTASYTDGFGAAESVTSAATAAVANVDDEAAGSLAVSGTVAEGNTLTASLSGVSDLDGATTVTYQWQQNTGTAQSPTWTNIAGATQASYSIPADQSLVSTSIRVVATTTDALGGTSEFIGNATTVANVNDVPTGGVSIGVNNGHSPADLAQGDVLTASNTLADPDGLGAISYTWKADATTVGTGASFTLTQAEVGKTVTVTASYTDGFGAAESVTSAATAAVANVDDEAVGSLAVSGTVAEGNTLTASLSGVSDLDGATSTAYRWQQRAGAGTQSDPLAWSDIAGATRASFSIPADQSLVGASIRVVATTTDVLGGTTEFIANDLIVDRAPSNTTISGHAYHWKTHALLSDTVVAVEAGAASASSDSSGRYTLDLGASDPVSLGGSRSVGDGTANSGITSADALAALRIAVGLNPNPVVDGVRAPISPYQIIAADVNNSGTVTSADALAILRMAVKLSTATPQQWLFVEETRDFWDEAAGQLTLTRSAAGWDRSVSVDPVTSPEVNLVGILKGDVNGSWAAPEGTKDLDIEDPTYFQDLATLIGVPENYWG